MILAAFGKELNKQKNVEPTNFLNKWLVAILQKKPENHVENIIHTELYLTKTKAGTTIITTDSPTGRTLLNTLYNYCLSYENFLFARWLHKIKSNDFRKD